jgi:ligand-binding sensor domain-containing protein
MVSWLGTSAGLIRFDGSASFRCRSNTIDVAFGERGAKVVDRTGAMWMGTENGSLVRMGGVDEDRHASRADRRHS